MPCKFEERLPPPVPSPWIPAFAMTMGEGIFTVSKDMSPRTYEFDI